MIPGKYIIYIKSLISMKVVVDYMMDMVALHISLLHVSSYIFMHLYAVLASIICFEN